MNPIDIPRCIRGCFLDHKTMTPEQRELAAALIADGPPHNQQVTLKLVNGAIWDNDSKAITRDGVTVRLNVPTHVQWVGGMP